MRAIALSGCSISSFCNNAKVHSFLLWARSERCFPGDSLTSALMHVGQQQLIANKQIQLRREDVERQHSGNDWCLRSGFANVWPPALF